MFEDEIIAHGTTVTATGRPDAAVGPAGGLANDHLNRNGRGRSGVGAGDRAGRGAGRGAGGHAGVRGGVLGAADRAADKNQTKRRHGGGWHDELTSER